MNDVKRSGWSLRFRSSFPPSAPFTSLHSAPFGHLVPAHYVHRTEGEVKWRDRDEGWRGWESGRMMWLTCPPVTCRYVKRPAVLRSSSTGPQPAPSRADAVRPHPSGPRYAHSLLHPSRHRSQSHSSGREGTGPHLTPFTVFRSLGTPFTFSRVWKEPNPSPLRPLRRRNEDLSLLTSPLGRGT